MSILIVFGFGTLFIDTVFTMMKYQFIWKVTLLMSLQFDFFVSAMEACNKIYLATL